MQLIELPIQELVEASWNANGMNASMLSKLRQSVTRFGLVGNLVVRPMQDGFFEGLSGNQRLQVIKELGYTHAPSVVVELGNDEARLLAQALNTIEGQDDIGMKAELVKEILKTLPQERCCAFCRRQLKALGHSCLWAPWTSHSTWLPGNLPSLRGYVTSLSNLFHPNLRWSKRLWSKLWLERTRPRRIRIAVATPWRRFVKDI